MTEINRPSDIRPDHLKQIVELIKTGDQVYHFGLIERLSRADLIAYRLKDDKVICTAALKNPTASYRTSIFKSSKATTSGTFKKELGYIVTHPDFENLGYCQDLLNIFFLKISEHSIFATTRKPAMVHILGKFGFSITGSLFKQDLILLTYIGNK